jgi:tetratricopeptide (TPR) repeat protein
MQKKPPANTGSRKRRVTLQALVITGVLAACIGGSALLLHRPEGASSAPPPGSTWLDRQETEARAAVRATPQNPGVQLALITLLSTAGRRYDALDAAREAHRLLPDDEPILLALADLLISTARLEEAEVLLRPGGEHSAAHRVRLASVQVRAGRRDAAVQTLRGLQAPDPATDLQAGQICLDALRPDLALPFLRRAALASANTDSQAALGLCLMVLGEYREAAETLAQAESHSPKVASLEYYLGSAIRLTDNRARLPEAAEHLRRAVEVEPEAALHRYELGLAYVQLRDWPNAAIELSQAAELKPEVAEFQRDLARIQEREGHPAAAAVAQSRYLRLLGDSPAAVALLEPLVHKSPQELSLALELGEAYYDSWLTPKTLALLHGLEAKQPKNADVLAAVFRGERASKHDENALKALDRLLELEPDKPELLEERIDLLQRLNRYEEAEALLERLRDREPTNAARHYQLALALTKWSSRPNRMELAERSLREVIRLSPADAEGYYRLGLVLQNMKRPQEAIPLFRKALDLSPRMTDAVRALARAYGMVNDTAHSEEVFRLYRALNARDEEQKRLEMPSSLHRATREEHRRLAEFYVRTGRFETAVAELEGVLHSDPGDRETRSTLVQLYGHLRRFQRQYEERALLHAPQGGKALKGRG